ncbi:MAG: hypothetical protein K2H85_00610, partial [Allobaculum sp.]|nr:hypothetical protein [Allobaculum sp.]
MKKFIFTVLASAMLLPTPILASEEMDEEVLLEDFEEMTLESAEDTDAQEVLEAANETTKKDTAKTYTLTLQDVDSKTSKKLTLSTTANNSTILETLLTSIPENYAFAEALPTPLTGVTEIKIKKVGSAVVQKPEEGQEQSLPIYFMCKTTSTIALEFASKDVKDGVLTKDTINAKLKAKNIAYTCSRDIKTENFNQVCYFSSKQLVPLVWRNNIDNPYQLTKTNVDSEATIDLALSNTNTLTLELKYFNPKSDKITINASNLQKALNAYNEEEGLDWEYEVKSLTPATLTLSAYTAQFSSDDFDNFGVYAILPEDTPITLDIKNKSEKELFIIDNLTLKDLKVSHSALKDTAYGTITESNSSIKSYFTTNFNKLSYLSCDFDNGFAIKADSKDFDPLAIESSSITGTIVASLTKLPEELYDREYTLVFEDAANPGSVVSREKGTWKQFFKKDEVEDFLTGDQISDYVPRGWKVAPIQRAGSKAKRSEGATVSEAASLNSDGKDLSFSIFSSDEIRVYVYGG